MVYSLEIRTWICLVLFILILLLPFFLRSPQSITDDSAVPLVIISPHNEAIRYEFGRAFERWHHEKHGKPVLVDWRNIGGTSEISRYLSSQFSAAFKAAWIEDGHPWNQSIAQAFNNPKINPRDEKLPKEVREARIGFLVSDVGIGIDLFFGGGEYDHSRQAAMGQIVPSGFAFTPEAGEILGKAIPQNISGEKWFDPDDTWYGVTVSSFGICYNLDSLQKAGMVKEPQTWADLGNPQLFRKVALADPTKSGSAAKAFEMVIQQAMAKATAGLPEDSTRFNEALSLGWAEGLGIIQAAAANARYFSDSASKVPMDVALGDAAAGMCIDFYGMFQADLVSRPDGSSRMKYVSPMGGTTVGCDPIAMLRGAPHPDLALEFIRFVLSMEGQRLWAFRSGTPGGPERYSLQRLPIRRDFYTAENLQHCSNPEMNPFQLAGSFTYHAEWTGKLFAAIRSLVRAMCLDTGDELRAAWHEIILSGGPEACPEAMAALKCLPPNAIYSQIPVTISAIRSKVDEIRLMRDWSLFFRGQYRQARDLTQRVRLSSS